MEMSFKFTITLLASLLPHCSVMFKISPLLIKIDLFISEKSGMKIKHCIIFSWLVIFEKDISNRRGFLRSNGNYLHQSKTHWRFGVEQLQDFVQCLIYCIIFVDKFHV
ncbi:hypothetical protein T4D_9571 [Trichinella pseudospiralis]|uniref:Uncharacterized protein n=1 Tax=Trichinella pseudospiralis TaxID=6337 RepID=A0A0V1FXH7_TRIPS|nr:hypothetical protein T4D_9571 [Trichinella pseudospiralis]